MAARSRRSRTRRGKSARINKSRRPAIPLRRLRFASGGGATRRFAALRSRRRLPFRGEIASPKRRSGGARRRGMRATLSRRGLELSSRPRRVLLFLAARLFLRSTNICLRDQLLSRASLREHSRSPPIRWAPFVSQPAGRQSHFLLARPLKTRPLVSIRRSPPVAFIYLRTRARSARRVPRARRPPLAARRRPLIGGHLLASASASGRAERLHCS